MSWEKETCKGTKSKKIGSSEKYVLQFAFCEIFCVESTSGWDVSGIFSIKRLQL